MLRGEKSTHQAGGTKTSGVQGAIMVAEPWVIPTAFSVPHQNQVSIHLGRPFG
jgi:hypothetical protein